MLSLCLSAERLDSLATPVDTSLIFTKLLLCPSFCHLHCPVQYHLRAAKSYLSLGRFTDAKRHYDRVLELDASNTTAQTEVQQLLSTNADNILTLRPS
jgi:tetratricopeptide (TPR) repeat protein